MRVYNVFISHSWHYQNAYNDLETMLKQASYFNYKNFSVPKDDPLIIHSNKYYDSELENKILKQMEPCSVILILAGVYASYSDSIDMEIKIAKKLNKPIIAIEPWGSQRTSTIVKSSATKIVKWNTESIVGAIKEVCK